MKKLSCVFLTALLTGSLLTGGCAASNSSSTSSAGQAAAKTETVKEETEAETYDFPEEEDVITSVTADGKEYAKESSPAQAIAQQAGKLLEKAFEGTGVTCTQTQAQSGSGMDITSGENCSSQSLTYTLSDGEEEQTLALTALWRDDSQKLASFSCTMTEGELLTEEKLLEILYNNDLVENLGTVENACRNGVQYIGPDSDSGVIALYSCDGPSLLTERKINSSTPLITVSLLTVDGNLHLDEETGILYFTENGGAVEAAYTQQTATLPETLGGYPLKRITLESQTGDYHGILSVPSSVEMIGGICSADNLVLPEGVKKISDVTLLAGGTFILSFDPDLEVVDTISYAAYRRLADAGTDLGFATIWCYGDSPAASFTEKYSGITFQDMKEEDEQVASIDETSQQYWEEIRGGDFTHLWEVLIGTDSDSTEE